LTQARAVLHYSPTLADEVRDGFALNKAFEMIASTSARHSHSGAAWISTSVFRGLLDERAWIENQMYRIKPGQCDMKVPPGERFRAHPKALTAATGPHDASPYLSGVLPPGCGVRRRATQ
jgi:hypothetical protein